MSQKASLPSARAATPPRAQPDPPMQPPRALGHVMLALSTCPDEASAQTIATALVSERLAACVNHIGGAHSTYFWDGRLQQDTEILLIIKTTRGRLPALKARLAALHPYALPELVALDVPDGNENYLDWVRQSVALLTRQADDSADDSTSNRTESQASGDPG